MSDGNGIINTPNELTKTQADALKARWGQKTDSTVPLPPERVFHFVDPIAAFDRVSLVLVGDAPSIVDGTIGVRHGVCPELADVSLGLDAFYCRTCRRNGRVSGAWVADMAHFAQ